MPPRRRPRSLKIEEEVEAKRDWFEIEYQDQSSIYYIKLPTDLSPADWEELLRTNDILSNPDLSQDDNTKLATSIRNIRRMLDVFMYDKIPREVVDYLSYSKLERMGGFLEEYYTEWKEILEKEITTRAAQKKLVARR